MDITGHPLKIMITHREVLQVYSLFIYSKIYSQFNQAWWSGCQALTKVKTLEIKGEWDKPTSINKRQLKARNKKGDMKNREAKELKKSPNSLRPLWAVGMAGLRHLCHSWEPSWITKDKTIIVHKNLKSLQEIEFDMFYLNSLGIV